MKRFFVLICILLMSVSYKAHAQDDVYESARKRDTVTKKPNRKQREHGPISCRRAYIGFSSGINNPAGFIGFDIDVPIIKSMSIGAGYGGSTWGDKLYLDARYYLKRCHRGWAFGAGITRNLGSANYKQNLETIYGNTETISLHLDAETNVFIGAYYFWTIGRRSNRLYVEGGYSIPITGCTYTQLDGDPLSDRSQRVLKILSPGGLMIGMGFSFGAF